MSSSRRKNRRGMFPLHAVITLVTGNGPGKGTGNRMGDSGLDRQSYRGARVTWSLALGSFTNAPSWPHAAPLRDRVEEHTKKRCLKHTGLQLGVSVGNQDFSMGSIRQLEQKCSCFSQHTPSTFSPGTPPG